MGILVGLGCRLESPLGVCFGVVQGGVRFSHHRRLDINISGARSLIADSEDEPPFRATPREMNTHQDLGGGMGNHPPGRRISRL